MQFRVLGPLELTSRGRTLRLSSSRRRCLLAGLLAADGRTVSAEQLIDTIWGRDPPASARASLQSHVSRLRDTLGDLADGPERIVTRGGGYVLRLTEDDHVDAAVFASEIDRVRELLDADPEEALELVGRALARWRGPAYADATEAVEDEVRRLHSLRRSGRDLRIDALLALGRHEAAVAELQGRVEQEPFDERLASRVPLLTAPHRRPAPLGGSPVHPPAWWAVTRRWLRSPHCWSARLW